jgi:hypothetical protein
MFQEGIFLSGELFFLEYWNDISNWLYYGYLVLLCSIFGC